MRLVVRKISAQKLNVKLMSSAVEMPEVDKMRKKNKKRMIDKRSEKIPLSQC